MLKDPALYLIHTRRAAHPEIPWRGMIDARNILIHAYDQVNPHLPEDIIVRDIPELLKNVRLILEAPVDDTPV